MKKLVLMMLFACACAYSETVATLPNDNGGSIVLTDVSCKDSRGYYVYSQSPNYKTLFGCWISDDAMVHITWADGEVWSYPISHFRINGKNADRVREREKNVKRQTY